MKYKVGDKVRVRRGLKASELYGNIFANSEMVEKEIVTIASVDGRYYKIEEDCFNWTAEMFEGLVEEELTAEEALKTYAEICSTYHFCDGCPIGDGDVKDPEECNTLLSECTEDALQRLKQWKADHEKKPIETEFVWYVQIVEVDTHILKHEEPLESVPGDETKAKILKKWCSEHDGKYYAIGERRCVVKE